MTRLIDADALRAEMYEEAMVKDSDMQRWDSGCWIRYKLFENVLSKIPSAEPRWIPMSERNPTVGQDVLVTTRNGRIYVVTYAIKEWIPGHCFHWKPCFMGAEYLSEEDVVAWMPLPKPYQEDKR